MVIAIKVVIVCCDVVSFTLCVDICDICYVDNSSGDGYITVPVVLSMTDDSTKTKVDSISLHVYRTSKEMGVQVKWSPFVDLQVNDYCDALDTKNRWCKAKVVSVEFDSSDSSGGVPADGESTAQFSMNGERQIVGISIHYCGWSNKWDATFKERDTMLTRLAKVGTHTAGVDTGFNAQNTSLDLSSTRLTDLVDKLAHVYMDWMNAPMLHEHKRKMCGADGKEILPQWLVSRRDSKSTTLMQGDLKALSAVEMLFSKELPDFVDRVLNVSLTSGTKSNSVPSIIGHVNDTLLAILFVLIQQQQLMCIMTSDAPQLEVPKVPPTMLKSLSGTKLSLVPGLLGAGSTISTLQPSSPEECTSLANFMVGPGISLTCLKMISKILCADRCVFYYYHGQHCLFIFVYVIAKIVIIIQIMALEPQLLTTCWLVRLAPSMWWGHLRSCEA